jgi:NAD(P)-dependent dehydrogenase (short-subunit alcohol dehydrogenase family)
MTNSFVFVARTGLWGLVNNAGLGHTSPIEWCTMDDYEKILNVNLHGVIRVTTTFLPLVRLSRGRVVNVASIAGRMAHVGLGPYTISKYGVEAFTDTLRFEYMFTNS